MPVGPNRRAFLTTLGSAAAWPLVAHAQPSWPTKAVRIICPIAAGGGIDATSRIVAAQLSQIWGQQVVVENKSGAGGNLAAEFVAHSDPDGYTIYIAAFQHAINRYLYPSLGYDPVIDFAPVTLICLYPLMMVVPNTSPAHSVREFIAYAKTNKVSYASGGHGTSLHLAGELFKRQARIEMTQSLAQIAKELSLYLIGWRARALSRSRTGLQRSDSWARRRHVQLCAV
jgi:tripartite-type tricarboxylate transporter receptor subunit TctC